MSRTAVEPAPGRPDSMDDWRRTRRAETRHAGGPARLVTARTRELRNRVQLDRVRRDAGLVVREVPEADAGDGRGAAEVLEAARRRAAGGEDGRPGVAHAFARRGGRMWGAAGVGELD